MMAEWQERGVVGFLNEILRETPNGEWIEVQYHPNGDWGVSSRESDRSKRIAHIESLTEGAFMASIDKTSYLRECIKEAASRLTSGEPAMALLVLQAALKETDVGKMKVWQPDEEPF